MNGSKNIGNLINSNFRKMLFSGFAIFCCIVLTPYIGTLVLTWNIPFFIVNIFVTVIRFFLPFVLIGFWFRNFSQKQSILIIVFAAGLFRIIAEFILSPVPFILITTPDYLLQVLAYTTALSIIAVGVSLFSNKKNLSIGLIITGIIFYCLWILINFN